MKKFLFPMMFLTATALHASKPDPAQYTIDVHVLGSTFVSHYGRMPDSQCLSVEINGQRMSLSSEASTLIALGDYKAKENLPKGQVSYNAYTRYDLLFPDGTTEEFGVSGIGANTTCPAG